MKNQNYILKNLVLIAVAFFITLQSKAQNPKKTDPLNIDTTMTDDELFAALDNFLDSITAPRTFVMVNAGVGSRYFNYTSNTSTSVSSYKKVAYAATAGYFHKSGLGINATVWGVNDGNTFNLFQTNISASYDYLKNTAFITGFSLSHYFTKDSLPFYTSPLQNEANAYFSYRRSWFKPSLSATYGWGGRTAYEQQKKYITLLNALSPLGNNTTTSQESISDFVVAATVRHDFYWREVLGKKNYIRLTPQLKFTAGTQKYGLNQSSSGYAATYIVPLLYNSQNTSSTQRQNFQPLSITAYLKSEFSIGKFFVQPQIVLDDYLPAATNNFTTAFMINTGIIL